MLTVGKEGGLEEDEDDPVDENFVDEDIRDPKTEIAPHLQSSDIEDESSERNITPHRIQYTQGKETRAREAREGSR